MMRARSRVYSAAVGFEGRQPGEHRLRAVGVAPVRGQAAARRPRPCQAGHSLLLLHAQILTGSGIGRGDR